MAYILTYKPEGADPKTFEFEADKLLNPEMIEIERLTGKDSYGDAVTAMMRGNVSCIHAFLYVFMKRTTPTLRPSDVQFSMSDVDFDLSVDEKAAVLRQLDTETDLTPEQIEARELLREEVGDAVPKEA